MNITGFGKKFVVALIDGIILNASLELILGIINQVFGEISLPNCDYSHCEIILGLVYFAALDSLPEEVSIGKKLVDFLLYEFRANKVSLMKFSTEYLFKIISIPLF